MIHTLIEIYLYKLNKLTSMVDFYGLILISTPIFIYTFWAFPQGSGFSLQSFIAKWQ